MNSDYIEGAKARARKEDYRELASDEWKQGFQYMHDLLAPVEQEIVLAGLKYQSIAITTVRELEDQFRDRGNAGVPAEHTAELAFPSE